MDHNVQYPYAFDENNNLVFIKDIDREHRHDHCYHCPNCGQSMTPRLGEFNEWCFAHNENQKCGPESYLHATAKVLLANKFNNGDSFIIGLTSERPCKFINSCPEEETYNCYDLPEFSQYDLKEYYDHPAEIEVNIVEQDGVTHFRPDVLLHSSSPLRKDIFIEVHYKNRSNRKKRESGHQIIEITIRDLLDLRRLEEMDSISESGEIQFIGFKSRGVTPEQIVKAQKEDHELNDHPYTYYDYPPCIRRQLRTKKK